jgi:peptide-methionine (S)-S-oxide reductase
MKNITIRAACAAASLFAILGLPACADESPRVLPAPVYDTPLARASGIETAVLSGGCFWGVQGVFEHVRGVTRVVSGYAGGAAGTARYEIVSTGTTGHAESVRIDFDPHRISYGEILRVYLSVAHDPTELNRQGPDEGTQYRSEIWASNPVQAQIATAYIRQLSDQHVFASPIVTRVDRYRGFYPAESYHQDYLIHNPDAPYIVFNDLPKIENLKRLYPWLYSASPVTVQGA